MTALSTVAWLPIDSLLVLAGGNDHANGGCAVAATGSSTPGVGWIALTSVLSASVVAAAITALVNTVLARRKSQEEERSRIRTAFAEALEAVAAYREFPYAIRRRRADEPAKERVRLSEELRQIQTRLMYYSTWIHAESGTVGKAYGDLVTELRTVAGGACREAWLADPITKDSQMNIGPDLVDLTSIEPYEAAYATAAEKYLTAYVKTWPWSKRN